MSWQIHERDLGPMRPAVLSTLFTVGNGNCCTRGTLTEEGLDAFRGVYVSGAYVHAGYGLNYPLCAADWLPAHAAVGGRPAAVVASHRTLDLRTGQLTRTATLRGGDRTVRWTEERFALLGPSDGEHLFQRVTVELSGGEAEVEVALGVDGDVRNHPAEYFKPGELPNCDAHGVRLTRIADAGAEGDDAWIVLHAPQSWACAATAARIRQTDGVPCDRIAGVADGSAGVVFRIGSPTGRWVFEKHVSLRTHMGASRADGVAALVRERDRARQALATAAARGGFAVYAGLNTQRWASFWARADVEIGGDARAQRSVRFGLWSTRIAAPQNAGAGSVGAKNLTGDWYRNAVFWDMELYQLPLLAAVAPELARNHVLYRARRLDAARRLAAQDGYGGARYPWQSYATGLEEPPQTGGLLYRQIHINAAVPWGILHYASVSGDDAILLRCGAEILIEQCRFWVSRAVRDDDGTWHIRRVCGPDEVHGDVSDNAYTNGMAAWLLRAVPDRLARLLDATADADASDRDVATFREMWERCGPSTRELAHWRTVADNLCLPVWPGRDVFEQFEGFSACEEPRGLPGDAHDLTGRKGCKQADVLMLFHALPGAFEPAAVERHYREYAPLCLQTRSLSLCTHAMLAARVGEPRDARRFFDAAAGVDLEDQYGNTCDGIHGAGESGVWLAAVSGFGGFVVDEEGVLIDPRLPSWWTGLVYRASVGGIPLVVRVDAAGFTVENHGASDVTFRSGDELRAAAAGAVVRIDRPANWKEDRLQAVIFDLDGVLVKTDRFHYLAWKELADELGLAFDEEANHQLRGISRQDSLRAIYRQNGVEPPAGEAFAELCERKNRRYMDLVAAMTPDDVLPGVRGLVESLREAGIRCAVSSASRNAALVLERTELAGLFDAVVSGGDVVAGKPDSQGFLVAAQCMRVLPWNCLGVEDAATGVEAIHRAGMAAVGIGEQAAAADVTVTRVADLSVAALRQAFAEHASPINPYLERNRAEVRAESIQGYAAVLPAS